MTWLVCNDKKENQIQKPPRDFIIIWKSLVMVSTRQHKLICSYNKLSPHQLEALNFVASEASTDAWWQIYRGRKWMDWKESVCNLDTLDQRKITPDWCSWRKEVGLRLDESWWGFWGGNEAVCLCLWPQYQHLHQRQSSWNRAVEGILTWEEWKEINQ